MFYECILTDQSKSSKPSVSKEPSNKKEESSPQTVKITKIFEFAGEEVK